LNKSSRREQTSAAVRNNGGGHWNHSFFWNIIGPRRSDRSSGPIANEIAKQFTTETAFREAFAKAATGRFGSGWAWLIVDKNKKLAITHHAQPGPTR
jgi:Fe-Mn family superoxide dismutase